MRILIFMLPIFQIANGISQSQAKASLEVSLSKNSVIQYQPIIITFSFFVHSDNQVPLRFIDSDEQIYSFKSTFFHNDYWLVDGRITDLNGKTILKDGKMKTKYELLKMAIIPMTATPIKIPKFSLNLGQVDINKPDSIVNQLIFETKESKTISVSSPSNNNYYQNDLYGLIGDMKISSSPALWARGKIGEPIRVTIDISGNGFTLPVGLPLTETDKFLFSVINTQYLDTIINDVLRSSKKIEMEVVPKVSGRHTLSDDLHWNYINEDQQVKKLTLPLEIIVSKDSIVNDLKSFVHNTVVAIDASESMLIEDFIPNRFGRIISSLSKINNLCHYPAVVFSGDTKREYNICELDYDSSRKKGTAIGNAIWDSIEILKGINRDNKSIIVIGDGDNTAGEISPFKAAEIASKHNIKIHAIGIGKDGKVPFGKDFFGRQRLVANTFSDFTLRYITEKTNGTYHKFTNTESMVNFIETIINQN